MKKKLTKKEETVPKKRRRRSQTNISEVPHSTFNLKLQLTNNYNNNFSVSFLSFFVAMGIFIFTYNEWRQIEEVEEVEN